MGGVDASQYFLELAGDRPTRQERLPDRRPTATTAFVSGWHIMDAGLFGHEAVRLLGGRSSSNRLIHGISVIFGLPRSPHVRFERLAGVDPSSA